MSIHSFLKNENTTNFKERQISLPTFTYWLKNAAKPLQGVLVPQLEIEISLK
jgi:hypothetical protein